MANTRIQIKRSQTSAAPASLNIAEPAYSYNSDKLFIGGPSGEIMPIGGGYYVNAAINAYNTANNAASSGMPYSNSVGAAANAWANTLATSGNNYSVAIGAAGNAYALSTATSIGTAGNNYTVAVGSSGNAYALATATSIGTAGNNYALSTATTIGTAGNNYATAVGTSANAYSDGTFVKLIAGSQTITGDIAITGNLTFLGNAVTITSNNLVIGDSLIYLAANNYSGTDIVDIGFVANYGNTTGANVHTGLFRDHASKEYFLFQGFDAEPTGINTLTPYSNNMVNAVLNADLKANNIIVNGMNVYSWVASAYTMANSANVLAFETGIGANNWANTLATAGNNYSVAIGAAGNAYALSTATSVGTAGNNYTVAIGAAGNAYALSTATSIGTAGNNYALATATSVGTAGNNYTVAVGSSGNAYALATATSIGTAGNNYATAVGASANAWAADASHITSGTLAVSYGGTGNTTFITNGVLFGNGTNPVQVTGAGTEGQVLQANATGVPQFGMLDGGSF